MHDQIQIHVICEEQYRELQNKSQFIDKKDFKNDIIYIYVAWNNLSISLDLP